jgi:Tfp pilus assembly protein PilX
VVRRLRAQEGSALPAAIAVLAVLSVLSAAVATNAVQLSDTSNHDRDSKRALEAAEAGLQAATYRINKLAPTNALCVTNIATAPIVGQCPPFTQDLGNGAQYTYYVTPVLSLPTDKCAGLPVQYDQSGGVVTVVQRCVTSTGQVNGVKRRVQGRVAAFQGTPIHPLGGILGVDGVTVVNSANVSGQIGSNGLIALGNSSSVQGTLQLGPSAPTPSIGNNSTTGQNTAHATWVLAPVDIGNSATVNDNGRISSGQDASTNTTYTAATRTLTMANNASLTLGGGTYNFCSVTIGNGAVITVFPGAKVRIFIDAPDFPDRPGSGCPAGTGGITVGENSNFSNPCAPDCFPENLQIYVYGLNSGNQTITFNNTGSMIGSIYAPRSNIVFTNSATINGGVTGKSVDFKNSVNFTWNSRLASLSARTLTLYYRTAWTECRKEPTVAGDPQSGC